MDYLTRKIVLDEPTVKVGDPVIVLSAIGSINCPVKVQSITKLADKRTELVLDWGSKGTSRVYLHDHGKTWRLKVEVN